jgi:nucleotide-binding universal stress UspA family protein
MHILYATDGSREAEAAGRLLTGLPLTAKDTITILTVLSSGETGPGGKGARDADPGEGERLLEAARALLSRSAAALRTELRRGHPVQEIRAAAIESHADLLAVGARGASPVEEIPMGSVAERLVRHGSCPVLVARPYSVTLRRVVLGVDDSSASEAAAKWLRDFPLPAACEVRLVAVLPLRDSWLRSHGTPPSSLVDQLKTLADQERARMQERMRDLAGTLRVGGKHTAFEVRSGDPALALLDAAAEGADLIVVGSHGESESSRFLIGSVSEKVVRHASCSVLVVR